ncbi:ferredoxin [Nonomuraea sp. NPDC005650]
MFDQRDEDGLVVLVNDRLSDRHAADVRRAAAVCPAQAIAVEDSPSS